MSGFDCRLICGDMLERREMMDPDSVDLVVTSPPYENAREYGIGYEWSGQAWVDWALPRFEACLRVCRGPVCWVVNGRTKQGVYSLVPERLQIALADKGYGVRRSMVYYRIGSMNGGGASRMPRNVYEPIIIATRERKPPVWADLHDAGTEAVIKAVGGAVTQRKRSGVRVDAGRRVQPSQAILKDVVDCGAVGGGNMGSPLATENEAPFSEKVVEPLIRAFCPPGGLVLDPFVGSGTVMKVALQLGRQALGIDVRESQIVLSRARIEEVQGCDEVSVEV